MIVLERDLPAILVIIGIIFLIFLRMWYVTSTYEYKRNQLVRLREIAKPENIEKARLDAERVARAREEKKIKDEKAKKLWAYHYYLEKEEERRMYMSPEELFEAEEEDRYRKMSPEDKKKYDREKEEEMRQRAQDDWDDWAYDMEKMR